MKKLARNIIVGGLGLLVLLGGAMGLSHFLGQSSLQRWRDTARYKGEKLTIEELLPGRVAQSNDAPAHLQQVVARLQISSLHPSAVDAMKSVSPGRARPAWSLTNLPGSDWGTFGGQLDANGEVLAEIRSIVSQRPRDMGWGGADILQMPRLPLVAERQAGQWLWGAVVNGLHQGELDAALTNLHAMIKLSQWLEEDWMLVNQMIRVALANLALAATWEALQAPGWNDEQLAALQQEWQRGRYLAQFERTFEMERAIALHYFAEARKGRTNAASQRIFGAVILTNTATAFTEFVYVPMWRLAWSQGDERFYLEETQPTLDALRVGARTRSWQQMIVGLTNSAARMEARLTPFNRYRFLLTQMAVPSWGKACEKVMQLETWRQMTLAAIALRRHELKRGREPESLSALVPEFLAEVPWDYMDGKPLRYRRQDEGSFVLYSVGQNGVDDGGDSSPVAPWNGCSWWNSRDLIWPLAELSNEVAMAEEEEVFPLIETDDVPLLDAIRNIARQADLTVQFDPTAIREFEGRGANGAGVTVRFENLTASDALEAVLAGANLKMVRVPGTRLVGITLK